MNQCFSVRQTKNVESKVRFVLLSRGCMRFIVTTVAICLPPLCAASGPAGALVPTILTKKRREALLRGAKGLLFHLRRGCACLFIVS